jgi:hypothetical protein
VEPPHPAQAARQNKIETQSFVFKAKNLLLKSNFIKCRAQLHFPLLILILILISVSLGQTVSWLGGTGDPPVPVGDSPTGTESDGL